MEITAPSASSAQTEHTSLWPQNSLLPSFSICCSAPFPCSPIFLLVTFCPGWNGGPQSPARPGGHGAEAGGPLWHLSDCETSSLRRTHLSVRRSWSLQVEGTLEIPLFSSAGTDTNAVLGPTANTKSKLRRVSFSLKISCLLASHSELTAASVNACGSSVLSQTLC